MLQHLIVDFVVVTRVYQVRIEHRQAINSNNHFKLVLQQPVLELFLRGVVLVVVLHLASWVEPRHVYRWLF